MDEYSKTYEVKWADMDPNRHMRHPVYLDYAAQTRGALFSDQGLPMDKIAQIGLGRMLFFDKILSGNIDIPCAACHHPTLNTGDAISLFIGVGGIPAAGIGKGDLLC